MNTPNIDPLNLSYLITLYQRLVSSTLDQGRKLIKGSVLLTLLKVNSNVAFKVFSEASVKFPNVSVLNLNNLEQLGYVKKISSVDTQYIITFLGIWVLECEKGILDIKSLLFEIQKEKIKFSLIEQPLSEKERLIIFSLITLRTFSKSTSMDLNIEGNPKNWLSIVEEKIIPELIGFGIISRNFSLHIDTGNEHPINFIMRRMNNLSTKSNGLFVSPGNSQYYLCIDLTDKENAINQIKYLIKKTSIKIDSFERSDNIKTFLCKVPNDHSLLVTKNFDFINYDWDSIIKEAIDRAFLDI